MYILQYFNDIRQNLQGMKFYLKTVLRSTCYKIKLHCDANVRVQKTKINKTFNLFEFLLLPIVSACSIHAFQSLTCAVLILNLITLMLY